MLARLARLGSSKAMLIFLIVSSALVPMLGRNLAIQGVIPDLTCTYHPVRSVQRDITQSQRLHRLAQYAQEVFSPQQMAQHLANHVLREHSAKLLKIFLMLACLKLLHAQLASKERTAKLLEATKILVRNAFQGAIVLLLRQIVMVSAKPVLLGSIPAAKEHLPTQLASHA